MNAPRPDTLPPHRARDLHNSFQPSSVNAATVFPIVVSAIAMGSNWALGAFGGVFRSRGEAPWIIAVLVLLQAVALRWVASQVRAVEGRFVPPAYWAMSSVQVAWLGLVAWYSHPVVGLGCALLMFAGTLNDVRYFHTAPAFRLHHALVWPGLAGLLLVIDLLGGDGLQSRWRENGAEVVATGWFVALVAVTSQVVIAVVGKQAGELDAELARIEKLERQRVLAEQERDLVGRTNALLLQGLTAGKFSHDVTSPIQMLELKADALVPHVTSDAGRRLVQELKTYAREAARMARDLATSVRRGDPVRETPVEELVEEAAYEATGMQKARGLTPVTPAVRVSPGTVWATAGHATTLANILTNAVAIRPDGSLEIDGAPASEHFYRLTIRDHGVPAAERDAAIARIQRAFQAQSSATGEVPADDGEIHRGYGVALLLGRLLVTRAGGRLDVEAPDTGDGVRFVIDLPRIAPDTIPADAYAALDPRT